MRFPFPVLKFGNKYDGGVEDMPAECFRKSSVEDDAAVVEDARSLSRMFTTVTFLEF
jgi:hypothetical protein